MKPIASEEIPRGAGWMYEVKYDGFRCLLEWSSDGVTLTSKNGKDLTGNFPEIVEYLDRVATSVPLPMKLDGELVVLNNQYQGNFPLLQKRGRMKNQTSIQQAANARPATFMAFDLLMENGKDYQGESFEVRKRRLKAVFSGFGERIRFVESFKNPDELQRIVFAHKGEGIIAKRMRNEYLPGKKHQDWFKIKNWRRVNGFLTFYDPKNDYFTVNIYEHDKIKEIGKCRHGLEKEAFAALKKMFTENGEKQANGYNLPPAICASIHTLDLYKGELREPEFARLMPELSPEECTMKQVKLDMAMLPELVELTNTAKVFWPDAELTKGDLLRYIREVSPFMLPFLRERALTLIRCPDGVEAEHFFQKHLPVYAPDFIDSLPDGEDELIICNTLEALVWFANHGTAEFHIPFQKAASELPCEIVFDLDPPSRDEFALAVQAANLIKPMLDDLELVSFIKTSGNKGLQIHIPIPEGSMTYEQTAIFTQAIAMTVEQAYPDRFTTERMKKKRNGRLYIDYVQHGKDKTIIAPYSPRMTKEGTVSTPLFWDEVTESLHPAAFTLKNAVERVAELGCPFLDYFAAGKEQRLEKVLELVGR
ncbi:DNA ligase D [Lentibacillus sediminis]|uniref:DNA ligase D n=1 Tax=Lentibacillus sediminis TaxID=1940529 RepID=UPI001EFD91B2|nr:DNA ligase D [Lentibacillus sediminis]